MPELPEAETIVRDLQDGVTGRTVADVEVARPDLLAPGLDSKTFRHALTGRTINGVTRRGKNIVLKFDDETRLMVNLGMTGRLVTADAPGAGALRHIGVRLHLEDAPDLLYDDVRRFGRLELLSPSAWTERDAALGVEPLSADFTAERLHELTARSRTPIRNWLLDQRRVAGIGNIYANEALFRARIHPARPANTLDATEASNLRDALREVLKEAIQSRGTTLSDYRDARGEVGGFQFRLRVYGREGESCGECGGRVERIVLSNRSAFFCPGCQK